MTKRKPTGRKPNINIVPVVEGNMLQHDLVITATENGYLFYVDPEIKIVLDYIIKEHGTVAIKINWHSPDLMLFVQPDLTKKVQALIDNANSENTTLDLGSNLTPESQSTALESDKLE